MRTSHKWSHSSTIIVFFCENELFQRVWGVCHTCGNSGGAGGVSVPIKNGEPREVGVLSEIPSVVGVWIFSRATHFVKYLMRESYSFRYGLKDLLPLLKLDDKLRLSSTIKTDDVTRSLNNGHMFRGQVGSLVADKITKIHSQYFW